MNDGSAFLVPLFTTILGVLAWVLYTKFRRGRMISPTSLFIALVTSIFGIRPLMMLKSGDYLIYGIDSAPGFSQAAALGAVGLIAFLSFRLLASLGKKTEPPRPVGSGSRTISLSAALRVSLSATALWVLLMIMIGGGTAFISTLFGGRSAAVSLALSNVPVIFSAIPVAGAVVAAIARIQTEGLRPLANRERIYFWLAIAASVVPPLALGIRRLLLPCVIVAIIASIRPKWNAVIPIWGAVVAIVGGSIFAALPYVRSAGARGQDESLAGALLSYFGENGLGGALTTFFSSNDTEMFAYVSFLTTQVGQTIDFGYGRATWIDLLWNAVPVGLSQHPTWTDQVLTTVYGGGCATIACPVPSVVGVLYMDGGFISVLVGSALIGLVLAKLDRLLESTSETRQLVTVLIVSGFMPGLVRGDTMNQIWLCVNVAIVTVAALAILRMLHPRGGANSSGETFNALAKQSTEISNAN